MIKSCIELTQVYRQSDASFLQLLREVRYNSATAQTMATLQGLSRPLDIRCGIRATRLYPVNSEVDRVNAQEPAALPTQAFRFEAQDVGPSHMLEQLNSLTLFPKSIELKVGAQVMMLKNVTSSRLVNGSRGVIEKFLASNDEKAGVVPVVRWLNGSVSTVQREDSNHEVGRNSTLVRRQFPLKLCWAMTIHKSQGMSIDYLEVDLSRIFERGQAYVALSRARTLAGLRVMAFDPRRFATDPRVVDFYRQHVKSLE